jgi:DNA-binding MarR family transcriptional regulator
MQAVEDTLVPADIIDSLELLMFTAIGMTAVALSAAAASDLTLPQWRALVVVGRMGRARVGDVAGAIGNSLPSASRLVRRLERQGLVATARDDTDRRATVVELTPKGRQVREEVVTRRRALMDAALADQAPRLPSDLRAGLATIAHAFNRYG